MEKGLRLLAASYIENSTELSSSAKSQVLNFLKQEGTDAQVKAFLLDGEIVELDEQAEKIVNDRFDNSEIVHELTGVDLIIAGLVTASVLAYKRFLSKAAGACRGLKGPEKTSCMNKFKQNAVKAQISTLNSGMAKCAKSKNPEKCKASIQKKILKLKAKLGAL